MTERHLNSREVRHICGNVSEMSLWRWMNDQASGFPMPLKVGRRRFWREGEIAAWLESRARHVPNRKAA